MKIYVAGKWEERKNVRKCMEELISIGHEITCDWTGHEYSSDGVVSDLSKFAEDDMEGVRSCDIVIALMTEGYHHKGSLCEMGGAIALGKRVYVIGNAADSCIFINHPLTKKILSVKEIEEKKMASKRLKKDIVIPAGTVFENVVGMNVEYGNGNYECTIGLTKDSAGSLVYGIGPGDKLLDEWFENCD